jgi:hypothetical protein
MSKLLKHACSNEKNINFDRYNDTSGVLLGYLMQV